MERRDPTQKALVLAGGGARGSYQVGVWRALMELDWHPQIITGTSVGGLNGAMFVLDLYETARDMWLTIRSRDVMELPEENADFSALHQFLRRVVKEGGIEDGSGVCTVLFREIFGCHLNSCREVSCFTYSQCQIQGNQRTETKRL